MSLPKSTHTPLTIEDLPDEVLEFILGFLPPYKDLHDCMLVSKGWRRCVLNVTRTKRRNLNKSISDFDIAWTSITPAAMAPAITKRYSHAATIYDNSMYVFGGCTCSMTTFNDLWRLDLSKRQWVRPVTMGTYPSPKACSTMVCYKDTLVLFGGWTYPPSYPLHQSWHLFNELHTYEIPTKRWTSLNTAVSPPPTAGHSVSVHGNWMIIFGGLQRACNEVHSTKTNDIWKLNLETWNWYKQETIGHLQPVERYGQSQTVLDDENILIMGGSGGPSLYYSDAWVLNMKGDTWRWIKVDIKNMQDAPSNLWCSPVCKVGDKIIALSKSRQSTTPSFMYISKGFWVPPRENGDEGNPQRNQQRIDLAQRQVDKDENVNGKRGTLKGVKRNNPDSTVNADEELKAGPSGLGPSRNVNTDKALSLSAFNTEHNHTDSRRQKRHDKILKAEEMWKKSHIYPEKKASTVAKPKRNVLGMYVMDISHALDEKPYVTWLPLRNNGVQSEGPEETVLYTLVEGKSELIMFGGIQKDANTLGCTTNLTNQVSNSLHFITAPSYVI